MSQNEYHERIVQYYRETEFAYKDSWDLDQSLSIHYGYKDGHTHNFPETLQRMNEIMMQAANVKPSDLVLDAGCGIGGSSIFLASRLGCKVTGISLSDRQVEIGRANAATKGLQDKVEFKVMDYSNTDFPNDYFDVVWGCESICYADDKSKFIQEASRVLKPGGRLVIADGFVNNFEYNDHPIIRRWLDGWQVNYLETVERFSGFLSDAGFKQVSCRDISAETMASASRLYRFYWLASAYLLWRKISFSKPATEMQVKNIRACKYQYLGRKKGMWGYALITGVKS